MKKKICSVIMTLRMNNILNLKKKTQQHERTTLIIATQRNNTKAICSFEKQLQQQSLTYEIDINTKKKKQFTRMGYAKPSQNTRHSVYFQLHLAKLKKQKETPPNIQRNEKDYRVGIYQWFAINMCTKFVLRIQTQMAVRCASIVNINHQNEK